MNPVTRHTANQPSPTVTREALAILLYRLIATSSTAYSAFAINPRQARPSCPPMTGTWTFWNPTATDGTTSRRRRGWSFAAQAS